MHTLSKQIFSLLCMTVIMLSACYDDKGNYTYHSLDNVVIDTAGLGMQEAYVISRYDTLRLAPNVYFNDNLVTNDNDYPLDYVWTIYTTVTSSGTDYTVDTLSHNRILEAPITRTSGTYNIQLTITNRNNLTETYFSVPCNVEEAITAGWMAFYECADEPGTSDVGLIVNPLVKKNIIQNKEFWDLYKSSNGHHLDGTPVRILHTVAQLSNDFVILTTNTNLVGVSYETFEQILSFEDFFYNAPTNRNISYYGSYGVTSGEVLINDNKVYTATMSGVARNNFFGVPRSGEYGQLAGWLSDVKGQNYNCIVYDQTNQRFLVAPNSSIDFGSFAGQDMSACEFDVNNVGMELLMGDWGRNYYDVMLMGNGNQRCLAVANFRTSALSSQNIGIGFYDVSDSPDILQATTMAASYMGEYVLYGAGSKVYNLLYSSLQPASVLWEAPSPNEEVVCVRLQKFYFTTLFNMMLPNANTVLHIATWNESAHEGKIYQYRINSASGAILSEPMTYTVPGKVKDMGWKYAFEM